MVELGRQTCTRDGHDYKGPVSVRVGGGVESQDRCRAARGQRKTVVFYGLSAVKVLMRC